MDEPKEAKPEQLPEPPRPRLIIEFAGPDLAGASIRAEGALSMGQMLAAAVQLDEWARHIYRQRLAGSAAAGGGILLPNPFQGRRQG
jgi:hypothetical protein